MSALESLAGRASGVYADLPLCIPESRRNRGYPEPAQAPRRRAARRSAFWRPRLGDRRGQARRSRGMGEDPRPHQGRAPGDDDREVLRGVLHHRRAGGLRILAVRRQHGKAAVLPKTFEDILYNMVGFARTFASSGIAGGRNHRTHVSTPLGVHPVGHMWARAAQIMGMGAVWAGSGASLPSVQQLALISSLEPTVWDGMSSYGLHLANLANAEGIDLAAGSVSTMLCSAEALSAAKRKARTRLGRPGVRLFRHDRDQHARRRGAVPPGFQDLDRFRGVRGARPRYRKAGGGG